VWDRLFPSTPGAPATPWYAGHDDIRELISLAKTISRWEDQIVCALITGVTNAAPRA
jgi:hypothetical protein